MARLHRCDWRAEFGFLTEKYSSPGPAEYLDTVEHWYEWARAGRQFEHIQRALELLPSRTDVSLIWGDSRPGNLMFDPDDQTVTAVLDWRSPILPRPRSTSHGG